MENEKYYAEKFSIDSALFYDAIVKSTDDYLYIVDMATDIALVTENMYRDFELPGRIVEGLVPVWGDLIHEKDQPPYYESIQIMLDGETDEHNVEYQVRNRKNEYVWVGCRGRLQRAADGTPIMFAGVVTNLNTRGKIDPITGLFTQQECDRAVVRLLMDGELPSGILLLGLDDFTRVNNLQSHSFGDAVLRQFAQDVQRMLPSHASIYRFDGDRFMVIYRGATQSGLHELFTKIQEYCSKNHTLDGVKYRCSASGGSAIIGQDSDDYPTLIKYASTALEISKNSGKNILTVFTPDSILPKLKNLEMAELLQNSVFSDMEGFSLVFQPVTDSKTLKVCGAEALLRWQCNALGAVSPVEFIPILESTGLIVPVGKWVFSRSVEICKKWVSLYPNFTLNINVSYLQLLDETFLPFVSSTLKNAELDAHHIVLELTESNFVTDQETLTDSFHALRSQNIRLAMDDFGTGYSSLGMLYQSPADMVKIDRSFITRISDEDREFNRSFIGAVIELCHSVGITVCAEGVEEMPELSTVRDLNADRVQGFYFSQPIDPDEFEKRFLLDNSDSITK